MVSIERSIALVKCVRPVAQKCQCVLQSGALANKRIQPTASPAPLALRGAGEAQAVGQPFGKTRDKRIISMKNLIDKLPRFLVDIRPWLLVFLIQVPSFRNFFVASSISHPLPVLLLSSATLLCIFYVLFNKINQSWLSKVLNSKILSVILIIVIWLIGQFIYPLKEGLNKGGTGDDAMQQPILAMMRGNAPYNIKLFDGAPISPGLGWLLLNAPFTLFGASSLFNVFYIGLTMFLYVKYRKNITLVNMATISIMLCFSCWEQIYSYHDILAIGFSFMTIFLITEYAMTSNLSAFFLGILAGVIATSRLIFFFLPALIALLNYRRFRKGSIIYGLTGTLTAIGIHIVGYITSEYYQPLHLLNRGSRNIPFWIIATGVFLSGIALLIARNTLRDNFKNHLFLFSGLLFTPLFFISIGELVGGNFNLPHWEASHYLLPALPCLIYSVFETYENSNIPLNASLTSY